MKSGDLCFDVGANVGERTRVFLRLGCRVVAVEPQPECVTQLRLLQQPRLMIEEVAVGSEPGTAEMQIAEISMMSSMALPWLERVRDSGKFGEMEWPATLTVQVTTLDDLIARHGSPDFCKIDVEGYEEQVLAGLSTPLRAISFEYTPEYSEAAVACVRRLQTLGLEWFNFSVRESLVFAWPDWRQADELFELLEALRRDPGALLIYGDVFARRSPPSELQARRERWLSFVSSPRRRGIRTASLTTSP